MLMKAGWGVDIPGNQVNYRMWISDANHMRAGFEESDGIDHICTSTGTTYNDGQWHHRAVTYDFVKVRMYIDGQLYQKKWIVLRCTYY
jgi:hypothetical protein